MFRDFFVRFMQRPVIRRGWGRGARFTAVVAATAAVVVVAAAGLVWMGYRSDGPPPSPAVGSAGPSGRPSAAATGTVSAPQGDSGSVTSSTGVDFGRDLPRLEGSFFARTTDPEVFAASVQAAVGYDYSSYQPDDAGVEARRITDEWLAGMTGEDGPLGPEMHRTLRKSVEDSVSPDELSYRIAAREVDEVDVVGVARTDNSSLRADAGNEVYLKVIGDRSTLHALTTTASVRTTTQQVGDVSGFTRTTTTVMNMIVRCDPSVDDGVCDLVGVIGGGASE